MIAKLIRLLYFWLMICPLGCLPQSSQPGNQSHSWILLIRSCHWWDILHYVLLQSYALLCQIFHSISECIYTCPRWPFISSSVMHIYIYTTNFGFHWLTFFNQTLIISVKFYLWTFYIVQAVANHVSGVANTCSMLYDFRNFFNGALDSLLQFVWLITDQASKAVKKT